MSENKMALWERVCVTDPAAVKAITGKQYKGNSPKPYWIVQRLTEEFGPCGLGWGFTVLNERMERLTDTDVLHVAVVRFWYVLDGKRGEFEQIGQTKAVYEKSAGGFMVDEDAPKKSVTDALVKCASYIGFAGDIFSGRWDDSKYVAWAREHYAEGIEPQGPADAGGQMETAKDRRFTSSGTKGPVDVAEERVTILQLAASLAVGKFNAGDSLGAYDEISGITDNEEKLFLWNTLKPHSKLRTFIKTHSEYLKTQEQAA